MGGAALATGGGGQPELESTAPVPTRVNSQGIAGESLHLAVLLADLHSLQAPLPGDNYFRRVLSCRPLTSF